jgi:hypothetical protein
MHSRDRVPGTICTSSRGSRKPASEPATLEYFMRDYVGRLKHHLAQALP